MTRQRLGAPASRWQAALRAAQTTQTSRQDACSSTGFQPVGLRSMGILPMFRHGLEARATQSRQDAGAPSRCRVIAHATAFLLLFSFSSFSSYSSLPASAATAHLAGPVGIFDLRYTLDYDYADPAQRKLAWDDCHAVATLQGIVNRDAPRLYIHYIMTTKPAKDAKPAKGAPKTAPQAAERDVDAYWWNKYSQPGEWLDGCQTVTYKTIEDLVAAYRSFINGVVLYDPNVASTSNVASSIAGIENLIAIRYDPSPTSLYTRLVLSPDGPRLPVKVRLLNPDGTSMFTGTGTIPPAPDTLGNAGVPPADEGRPDSRPILPLATCHLPLRATARPSTGSAKCDPYIWFIENYLKKGKCNTAFAGYYIDQFWLQAKSANKTQHTLTNHDFFVSQKAFFYDLSPFETTASDDPTQPPGTDYAVYNELLRLAYEQNNVMGASSSQTREQDAPAPLSGAAAPTVNCKPGTVNRGGSAAPFLHVGGYPPWFAKYSDTPAGKAEPKTIRLLGAYNAILDADAPGIGAIANCSFWQHFPTDASYPQPWTTRDALQKRGLLTPDGKVNFANRDFIIFYVGCFDNPAWTSRNTLTIWDDPNRGKLPLMWCVSPIIEQRAPQVLHYWRHTATPNDYFTAGDNGAGYTSVGQLQAPRISGLPDGCDAWAAHCKPYYEKWGLSVTGFIINTFAPPLGPKLLDAFQSFSPNGIVPNGDGVPVAALHKNMPILRGNVSLTNTKTTLDEAARRVVANVKTRRPFHFHWFRAVNMSPTWYVELMDKVHALNPNIVLLDAPSYFELLRIWLEQNEAKIPNPKIPNPK